MPVVATLVRTTLVRKAVDLRALGPPEHAPDDDRARELVGCGQHGVTVDHAHRDETDLRAFLGAEQLDLDALAFGHFLLLATRGDHRIHSPCPLPARRHSNKLSS